MSLSVEHLGDGRWVVQGDFGCELFAGTKVEVEDWLDWLDNRNRLAQAGNDRPRSAGSDYGISHRITD